MYPTPRNPSRVLNGAKSLGRYTQHHSNHEAQATRALEKNGQHWKATKSAFNKRLYSTNQTKQPQPQDLENVPTEVKKDRPMNGPAYMYLAVDYEH